MDFILGEVIYVLKRIYKHEKKDISSALKKLLLYKHLYTENKLVTFEALEIYAYKNIDFADSLLCAKSKIEGFEIASFDKDIGRCLKQILLPKNQKEFLHLITVNRNRLFGDQLHLR